MKCIVTKLIILMVFVSTLSVESWADSSVVNHADLRILGPAALMCAGGMMATAKVIKVVGFSGCGGMIGGWVIGKIVGQLISIKYDVSKSGFPKRAWEEMEGMYTGRLTLSILPRVQIDLLARKYAAGDFKRIWDFVAAINKAIVEPQPGGEMVKVQYFQLEQEMLDVNS